jgi:hypothetical protein
MSQSFYGGYMGNAGRFAGPGQLSTDVIHANIPNASFGSLMAGGNFMGGEGSAINPDALKKDARQQKIYNKGMGTDNPYEREFFLKRTGPQLPLAGIGNVGGMITNAQFYNGPQMGQMPAGFQNKIVS